MYPWRKPELFKPLIKSLNRFHSDLREVRRKVHR